jgi:GT2 family glycosyltransferase
VTDSGASHSPVPPRITTAVAPRTVAIVLNYQREEMTAACVAALEASTEPPRVLIVDNASPDGSGERLRARFPQHAYLQTGGNLGYAGGNARGMAWAHSQGAERIFVVNDDAEPDPQCVALLNAALDADYGAAVASPMMLHAEPANVIWWGGGRFSALRVMGTHEGYGTRAPAVKDSPAPYAVTSLCGCAMMFRADAVRALGGFREDFGSYVEDLELSVRYTRAGLRLLYVPRARLVHKVAFPEPAVAPWKIVARDRNRRRLAKLHLSWAERVRFWGFFLPSRVLLMGAAGLRLDGERVRALWRGVVS